MGRSEKYHQLPRHIYALVFPNRYVYIGQTKDLKRREAQHRNARKLPWGTQNFHMVHLTTVVATTLEAEDHEYAWRYTAFRHGHNVYILPPNIVLIPRGG